MSDSLRSRNYFLTINEGAKCFINIESIIKGLNCNYAYINHNETNNNHYHALIIFKNPRYLSSIKTLFEGAHIEICRSINITCRYLLHLDDDEKKEYSIDDIKCNFDINPLINSGLEYFNPNNILDDIENGCVTLVHFYKKYGAVISKYITLIEKLIASYNQNNLAYYYLASLSTDDIVKLLQDKLQFINDRIGGNENEK